MHPHPFVWHHGLPSSLRPALNTVLAQSSQGTTPGFGTNRCLNPVPRDGRTSILGYKPRIWVRTNFVALSYLLQRIYSACPEMAMRSAVLGNTHLPHLVSYIMSHLMPSPVLYLVLCCGIPCLIPASPPFRTSCRVLCHALNRTV